MLQTPPPRLAIFDFDGTLADSRELMLEAIDDAARRFGFRRPAAVDTEALRGQDSRTVLRALEVPLWKLPQIARHIRRVASERPPPALFAGAAAMLRQLSQGQVTLGLVTSNSEANARRALGPAAAGIEHWACDATPFGKAVRFRRVLRRAGLAPAAGIAIGDELRDIEAARAVGLRCGAVAWGFATPEALAAAQPDMMFTRMEDIPAWFGL